MKILSIALLFAVSAYGQTADICMKPGQTGCLVIQPSDVTPGFAVDSDYGAIVTCDGTSDGKAKNCEITPGHTLDEAINAVLQTANQQSGETQEELNQCWQHDKALYDIALSENKSLKRCSAGLDAAVKRTEKIQRGLENLDKP